MASSNMVVQNNIAALNVHRNMNKVGDQQMKASEKLSSGYRINRAADDAAGLAISEKMRGQIRGLNMASRNVEDAISLIKTAEGGMQGIDDMLHRIRELIDYAANDTNENNNVGTGDRQAVQDEIDALIAEIDDMSERVEFNKKKLINGSFQDTTAQLANAQSLFDLRSLEQVSAQAKVTSMTGSLTTAQAALTAAQTALDTPTTGETALYNTATTTYINAETTYNLADNEYKAAKDALSTALADAGIANLAALNDNHFDVGNTATYLGATQASAVTSAILRYNAAAITLGVDELHLQDQTALWAGTNFATGLGGAALVTGTQAEYSYTDASTNAVGAVGTWDGAKATYAGATLRFQNAVTTRDTASDQVKAVQTQLADAQKELNTANTRFIAADTSLTAARDLHNAGHSQALHFQVGANGGQSLIMSIGSIKSNTLGIGDGNGNASGVIDVVKDSGANITASLDVLDQALSYVTTERSKLGAATNRMEYTKQSLDITSENLSDAESRIRDADMAKEMMNKTKADTLQQVSVAMLAQANQLPQSILQLLR